MLRSIKKISVLAPIAGLLVGLAAPAHAAENDGPYAYGAAGVGGLKNLPVATVENSAVALPKFAETTLLSVGGGSAYARRAADGTQSAATDLGQGFVRELGLDLTFSNLKVSCLDAPRQPVQAVTTIVGGRLAGRALPTPLPVNYRVPVADPNLVVTLNKQVKDALGGTTVSALSIEPSRLTKVSALGVAHCAPAALPAVPTVKGAGRQMAAVRDTTVRTLLTGPAQPVVLAAGQLLGGLPALPATGLPALPALPVTGPGLPE